MNYSKRKRHIPSGYILGWLDRYGKTHTKSIALSNAIGELRWRNTMLDAKTELFLLQLDLQQQEFEANKTLPPPIITAGLTRRQVREELINPKYLLTTKTPEISWTKLTEQTS